MPKTSLFIILAAASFAAGAQQQQREQKQAAPDKQVIERARTDGSAGGTAPIAQEKRKAVGAGAGPHLHETAPSPQKLPKDQPVQPAK